MTPAITLRLPHALHNFFFGKTLPFPSILISAVCPGFTSPSIMVIRLLPHSLTGRKDVLPVAAPITACAPHVVLRRRRTRSQSRPCLSTHQREEAEVDGLVQNLDFGSIDTTGYECLSIKFCKMTSKMSSFWIKILHNQEIGSKTSRIKISRYQYFGK